MGSMAAGGGEDEERRLSNWAVELILKLHGGGTGACYGRWSIGEWVRAGAGAEVDDGGEPK